MTSSVPAETVFSYTGDGATAEFSFPLRFLEAADLIVYVDGVPQVLGTHYAVDGAGELGGGAVTFELDHVPAAGTLVRIERATAPKQTVDLTDVGRTPGDTLETQLDRLAMVAQDQAERVDAIDDLADEFENAIAEAEASATAAASSASAAATSATNAATSATAAASSATAAASAEANAETAEANAETAETNAETAATAAAASETAAAGSASAASTSATNAASSATTAITQAGIATTKASEASASATAALASEVAAAAAETAAQQLFDLFGDQWLGAHAPPPTLDNDGSPLEEGDLYWDSTNKQWGAWDATGEQWIYLASGGAAGLITFTPAGNLSATNVQGALEELDSEKQPLDADLTAIAALATTVFGRSLLALADGAAGLTAFGVSAFVQTLLDDASAAAFRTTLGMGTGNSPQFAGINLGHASDTPVTRAEAGVIAVGGVPIYSNVPQNSRSAAYTLVLADAQKHIYHPTSDNNARTFAIPANSAVPFPIGTAITFVNRINTVTIAINSDTLILAGPGTTGSRTLAANGMATAIKTGTTEWVISGTGLT